MVRRDAWNAYVATVLALLLLSLFLLTVLVLFAWARGTFDRAFAANAESCFAMSVAVAFVVAAKVFFVRKGRDPDRAVNARRAR